MEFLGVLFGSLSREWVGCVVGVEYAGGQIE
jgi:hypothetical protein